MDQTTTVAVLIVAAAGLVGVLVGVILVLLLDRYAVRSGQPPDEPRQAPVETVDPDDIQILEPEPDFRDQAEQWARRAGRPEAAGPIETKLRAIYDIGNSRGHFNPKNGGHR